MTKRNVRGGKEGGVYARPAGLSVARLGGRYYAYEKRNAFPAAIPTAEITRAQFEFLRGFPSEDEGVPHGRDVAVEKRRGAALETALRQGHLVARPSAKGASAPKLIRDAAPDRDALFVREFARSYQEPTFFGVPADFPAEEADVGILGVPVAFNKCTLNTRHGYRLLRESSAFGPFHWFDVCRDGLFTDINLHGVPAEICKNVLLKDFGYVEQYGKTLGETFGEISRRVAAIVKARVKPLFIGGDHAVTFPVLSALLQADPKLEEKLVLVHFDAHDDLFFDVGGLTYSHATPFMNIFETTRLRKILSFGLRSAMTRPARGAYRYAEKKYVRTGRIAQYGIAGTLALLNDPERLAALFPKGSKIYVSIDVDCLSESLIGGYVNAPCVDGLGWKDLFLFLGRLAGIGELVGADVVEFCHGGANFCAFDPRGVLDHMNALLLYLIHLLAGKSPHPRR